MSIPKIIHYFYDDIDVWEKNTKAQVRMCMNSWLKYCPEYKLMLWHDKMPEFQAIINKSLFAKRAYELKLWAFVADYIRCYALYNYGGIYLDTDVELLNNFDNFLENNFFTSIEGDILSGENVPEPAVMGAIPHHKLMKKCLEIYESEDIFEINNFIANVIMKKALKECYGFEKLQYKTSKLNDKASKYFDKEKVLEKLTDLELYRNQSIWQDEKKEVTIYPCEYFCPAWEAFKRDAFTNNTVSIHWNQSSWWGYKKLQIFKKYKCNIKIATFIVTLKMAIKNLLQKIFSIKNSKTKTHKVWTILGIKVKIRRKQCLR